MKGGAVNELALFSGAGGGILGGHLLGWRKGRRIRKLSTLAQLLAADLRGK